VQIPLLLTAVTMQGTTHCKVTIPAVTLQAARGVKDVGDVGPTCSALGHKCYVRSHTDVKCSWFIPLMYRCSSAQSSSRFMHLWVLGRNWKITSRTLTNWYY